MFNDYGTWNWTNCWRATFICILLGAFFFVMDWKTVAQVFGCIGGVAFILMFVIRFEDVAKVIDESEKR